MSASLQLQLHGEKSFIFLPALLTIAWIVVIIMASLGR